MKIFQEKLLQNLLLFLARFYSSLLIQKVPGDKIIFKLIELHEAEQLYKEHVNNISEVIKNIKELN